MRHVSQEMREYMSIAKKPVEESCCCERLCQAQIVVRLIIDGVMFAQKLVVVVLEFTPPYTLHCYV